MSRSELKAVLRKNFLAFLERSVRTIVPGMLFQPNWHIDAIAHQLDQVSDGAVLRLIINQPPRSLKSITVSVAYVGWRLGNDPTLRIIVVSYNAKFAAELHRQFRVLVESEWYRNLFPGTQWAEKTESEFITTKGGGRFGTSTGAGLTGRGGDLLILDDPTNAADIQSEPARTKVRDFFSTVLLSRLNEKKSQPIILVMQRLHEDDLAGYLLNQDGWRHLCLPAIAPDDADVEIGFGRTYHRRQGEALHPAREDLETLNRLKVEMGSLTFSAQYQQAPLPLEGNLVKRDWIESHQYDRIPDGQGIRQVVQSWDVATTSGATSDYSVCTTWLAAKSDTHLLDVWRGRLTYPELRKMVIAQAIKYKPATILIEDVGPGQQLIQDLWASSPQGMTRPIGRRPNGSKEDRMAAASARFEAGMVHLPKDAPWLDDYMLEILGFPSTKHDDQVDSTTQFLEWWWNWPSRRISFGGPIFFEIPRHDPLDAPHISPSRGGNFF